MSNRRLGRVHAVAFHPGRHPDRRRRGERHSAACRRRTESREAVQELILPGESFLVEILQVLDSANARVKLVSFAVYRIPHVAAALVGAARRGVRMTVFDETPDKIECESEYSTIRALSTEIVVCSTVYHWPRAKRPFNGNHKPGILHVKCAVADGDMDIPVVGQVKPTVERLPFSPDGRTLASGSLRRGPVSDQDTTYVGGWPAMWDAPVYIWNVNPR